MKRIMLIFGLISIMILVSGCIEDPLTSFNPEVETACEECETCKTCQLDNKAMLDVYLMNWAINVDNDEELFFEYSVRNFGNVEAKNVKVECKLFSSSEKVVKTGISSAFNVASQSTSLEYTTTTASGLNENDIYIGACYVKGCSKCDILYKRIPSLAEMFEN